MIVYKKVLLKTEYKKREIIKKLLIQIAKMIKETKRALRKNLKKKKLY